MYIDIAGNGTATPAEIGTNRIPLNAEKADYAENAKRDENGDRILVSYVKVDVSDSELGNENLINADSLGGSPANDYLLKTSAINLIYPVGSIYITFSEENPAALFGVGTWTKIEGKFLLGASSLYVNGQTGGEATHTLTASEMPSHSHPYQLASGITTQKASASKVSSGSTVQTLASASISHSQTSTQNIGGGRAHNNMPPYLAVNMWKRVG